MPDDGIKYWICPFNSYKEYGPYNSYQEAYDAAWDVMLGSLDYRIRKGNNDWAFPND
jgi:hypothetical protein